jgi:LL-diaminopimelate aminotransferase
MSLQLAERMSLLEPYLFADLDKKKAAAQARGLDVISLSIGDPDMPTPEAIVKAAAEAVADPSNHGYPAYQGSAAYRQACSSWMARRFSVELNPDTELVALIGSKEGIFHLTFVLCGPGDTVLCPEPAYPVYATATRLAGARPVFMPLRAEAGFLPDLSQIATEDAQRAKAMWINYPNNPTGAVADRSFLESAVAFCREHDIVLCSDAAYSEIAFDGHDPMSIFQIPGAAQVAVEFHSMSKSFNMTGWRVGFAAGRSDVIGPLGDFKSNLDSGIFGAVQKAGIKAMELWPGPVKGICETYLARRDSLVQGLRKAGFEVQAPRATFYVWMAVPGGDDKSFCSRLIDEAGVVVTPGSGFGPSGAGFVRFSLTVDLPRLDEVVARIAKL